MLDRRTMLSLAGVLAAMAPHPAAAARCVMPTPPDPLTLARAELLTTLVATGSLDEAIKRHPGATLSPELLQALRAIPADELAAVRSFQGRLDKVRLPQLVLKRETLRRALATGECHEPHTPPTNQAPK